MAGDNQLYTVEEALDDLRNKIEASDPKRAHIFLNGFVELMGTTHGTVQRWLGKRRTPNGVSLVKLRVFLTSWGYQLSELVSFDREILAAGELLGFDVFSLTHLARVCDVTEDHMLRFVRLGIYKNTSIRIQLNQMVEENRPELAKAKARVTDLHAKLLGQAVNGNAETQVRTISQHNGVSVPADMLVYSFTHQLLGLVAIAENVRNLDPKYHKLIREQTGGSAIQRVTSLLAEINAEGSTLPPTNGRGN